MYPALSRYITDFGDTSLTLPLAAGLALLLWRVESRAAAWAALRALLVCLVALLVLKLVFMSCGRLWNAGMRSPSGHTGISVTVYGTLGIVAGIRTSGWLRWALVGGLLALVSGIAASRIVLGAHNLAEVLTGLGIGAVALGNFALCYRPLPDWQISRARLVGAVAAASIALGLMHGERWPGEQWLWQFVNTHGLRAYCTP